MRGVELLAGGGTCPGESGSFVLFIQWEPRSAFRPLVTQVWGVVKV